MKKFSQFISESRGSRASEKAYRLGLSSDGHGGWLDRGGKLIAQTVNGDLKMIDRKSPSPEKAELAPVQAKPREVQIEKPPAAQERPIPKKRKQEEPAPETEKKIPLTIVFGRFNPPTVGHEELLKTAQKVSSGGDLKIYPSRAQDNTKNPLNPPQKIKYMRKMFPEFKDNIINDDEMRTIFDVLVRASEDGYNKINLVVGANRSSEFDRLAQQYNGSLYSFTELNVIPTETRDPDAIGPEGTSASRLRKAALEDDFETFKAGLPKRMSKHDMNALFFAVQRVLLGKTEVERAPGKEAPPEQEVQEMWKYAPKLDPVNLREQYYQEKIFNVGDIVENLNTGLVGQIKRRGPNYLICVTEEGHMFKSWIKDVTEWTDISGVPASQREVGTDALRKYVMMMTGTKEIKNFISKYKRSQIINK